MMKVFERENIDVNLLVGCSGGAIYAALISLGWSAQKATETTLRMWTRDVAENESSRRFCSFYCHACSNLMSHSG